MDRFWVSWYSKDGDDCTEPLFQTWISGETFCLDEADTEMIFCAVVEAETEGDVWKSVQQHYPDYRQRFIDVTEKEWKPSDRFQGFENRTSLEKSE